MSPLARRPARTSEDESLDERSRDHDITRPMRAQHSSNSTTTATTTASISPPGTRIHIYTCHHFERSIRFIVIVIFLCFDSSFRLFFPFKKIRSIFWPVGPAQLRSSGRRFSGCGIIGLTRRSPWTATIAEIRNVTTALEPAAHRSEALGRPVVVAPSDRFGPREPLCLHRPLLPTTDPSPSPSPYIVSPHRAIALIQGGHHHVAPVEPVHRRSAQAPHLLPPRQPSSPECRLHGRPAARLRPSLR